ncbi:serine/threonine protein kinase, partial [bacterium]|nr:serine/threonine protein kinase [bacterium]
GRGLEGEVWRARDGQGGPAAAVKLFTEPGAGESFRAAGIPVTPDHPNLCRVLAGDPDAHPPFLATDYVEGPTLREVLASERYVPLSAAIPCVIQVLRGLAALHKEKLAHHDLRPENVLIDEKGAVRLSDVLTEAAQRDRLARLSGGRAPGGTPPWAVSILPYLAPELRKTLPAGPLDGPRADMYAFGVLAYEMLTGERPVEGFDLKLPSQKDKRIPKVLDELALRCLERTTRTRTPSALGVEATLLEGLERAGFQVFAAGDAVRWVKATPWREPSAPVGEETGRFTNLFKKLADEKQ